ncbi:MAG: trigger factor [Deltaproteobacteria bacterium]|nr:trigger factor [Deltaproteobacteria bacterium]
MLQQSSGAPHSLKVNVEDLSAIKKKVNVLVSAESVDREFGDAYRQIREHAVIAGFRKGSIPLNVIKAKYGAQVAQDVTVRIIEATYPQALKDNNLIPVEPPHLDVADKLIEEGKEFSYSATVETSPRVDVNQADYIGVPRERRAVEITEDEVTEGLEKLRQTYVHYKDVERPASDKDMVVVDFKVSVDGAEQGRYATNDYQAVIGERGPLPGFDEALRGAVKGEKREARLKFPDNISEKELKGKEGLFSITVKAVKEKTVPELDAEFAKTLGCETIEQFREKARQEFKRTKEDAEKERLKSEILSRLIEKYPFEIPAGLLKKYLGMVLNNVMSNIQMGVAAPGDSGLPIDALKEKYHGEAVRKVREDIILDAIAEKEKVEVAEEEYEAAVKHIADTRKVSMESLMARIEKEGATDAIIDGLKHEKVFIKILASLGGGS